MRRLSIVFGLLLPMSAWGEVVGVRGFADVDLSSFDCTSISESRLLHRVCYDEAHRYLIAQIGDEYYESCDVGSKTIDGLMDSEHVVAYHNQRIRPRHKCTLELRHKTGIATLSHSTQ
jgi:hypothetical protein